MMKFLTGISKIVILFFSTAIWAGGMGTVLPFAYSVPTEIELQGSTLPEFDEKRKVPIVGFMMSMVVPGAGQRYGGASWMRSGIFSAIDLIGLAAWANFTKDAEDIRIRYERFADESWFLDTWIWNTHFSRPAEWNNYPDLNIAGSHSIYLRLYGEARAEFGKYVNSEILGDIITAFPGIGEDPEVTAQYVSVVRDRDFYENIGKYDQFVGGWIDARLDWYAVEKQVESTTETIIMTPRKNSYIKERDKNNLFLNYSKYTVSAILFNHVISGLDAIYVANRYNSRLEQVSMTLTFDPENSFGIGGVRVSISF